jgi:hypothetical protein
MNSDGGDDDSDDDGEEKKEGAGDKAKQFKNKGAVSAEK